MCLDHDLMGMVAAQRLDEARAEAARQRLIADLRPPLNVRLGHALIRLGRRLAAGAATHAQPSMT
ncbi:MAG: hypothetical protein HYU41_10365 [Candidatus Rokubacteria bacterium]|nr:hypothetical protein [Candidatus Rokubacteria bacterium]